jgi:ABC-type Fe3+/spermidine/putrescine transport system ATPase subunit
MVTSDRIAVMNRGRIEQVGTPEEIYEHPRTQFVASFIGRTNCLSGVVSDGRSVRCNGLPPLTVNLSGSIPASGLSVALSIRPQEIRLAGDGATHDPEDTNVLSGRILRHAHLGEARDYLVGVAGTDVILRVVISTAQVFRLDDIVRLVIPAGACRVIP